MMILMPASKVDGDDGDSDGGWRWIVTVGSDGGS